MRFQYFLCLLGFCTLLSCQKTPQDKATQLQNLKNQQRSLSDEIKTLEKEMGVKDSNRVAKQTAVEVQELRPQVFNHYLELQGGVEAADNIAISPQQPGIIKSVLVVEGQNVKKGQLLATLDDAVFQQGVQELQTQIDFANIMYQKQKQLWDQKIGTEVQFLQAKTNKEALERKLATLRQQADLYNIYSPISGTVEEVNVKVGEGAAIGVPIPPFRIINLNTLTVKADVAETYITNVRKGDVAEIFFPDLDKTISAKITNIGTIINNIGRTFPVELRIPSSVGIRPNMIAMVKIKDYAANSAITVPLNTIQNSEEGQYVFVAEEQSGKSMVVKRNVTVGLSFGDIAEIKNGLRSGDKLIVTGYQDVAPGQAIKF